MSIVGIFTRSRPSIRLSGAEGGIFFDAVLEESSELQTQVTEFPIETGTVGNDHAVQKPLKLMMTVGVSDNSFRALAARASQFSTLGGAVGSLAVGEVISRLGRNAATAGLIASVINANAAFGAGQAVTRSQSALDEIRQIQRANAILDVVTLKKDYIGCMITSTRQQTTKENENGLELVIEFQQMLVINFREDVFCIPPSNDTAFTQAQQTVNLGQVVGR